jgi:hypothetical protein
MNQGFEENQSPFMNPIESDAHSETCITKKDFEVIDTDFHSRHPKQVTVFRFQASI